MVTDIAPFLYHAENAQDDHDRQASNIIRRTLRQPLCNEVIRRFALLPLQHVCPKTIVGKPLHRVLECLVGQLEVVVELVILRCSLAT